MFQQLPVGCWLSLNIQHQAESDSTTSSQPRVFPSIISTLGQGPVCRVEAEFKPQVLP